MPAVLLLLFVGMLTGAFFRIQTLVALALLVLVAEVAAKSGVTATIRVFGAEAMLQLGYLAGVYARSVLERLPLAVRFRGRAPGPSA